MGAEHEREIHLCLAEGILSKQAARALEEDARRQKKAPLDLLVERGQLSEQTRSSLAEMLRDSRPASEGADPDVTASIAEGANPDVTASIAEGANPDVTASIAEGANPDATASIVERADPDATASMAGTPDRARALELIAARGPGAPVFPVVAWDRYECVRFLGEGGMGKVFLARDLRLRREVAIKFVHGDRPELTARLLREARAQARVSHDRVCKVFEVGEVQGEIYIAMQYIDGQPLSALTDKLTTEQKVMVVRDAAEGVHEAHRAGIIHRDLKPANLMVERAEDGRLKTYVMDFGVARDWTDGHTMTGAILGTPHYMAPEQARGEVGRLDRRADVYSLGATLYSVLTGQPPIPGTNGLEVINNIATVEPRAPRSIDPDIPVDLEAIVLKCLEKDRSARYDSARALAEDLDCFLAGEPVRAARVGRWYRARKWLGKHRRAVLLAVIALSMVTAALGWGIRARGQAAERERLARRFTELAERIEAMARYSALAPLHDIRGDQRAIRARMQELEAEIAAAGPIAAGPGNYAIGRGHLALGDDASARGALESAWKAGFREPRAAYALALVMGHLYQQQLIETERIRNDEQRAARKKDIEERYRDPALAYLKQSEGADVPSKEYVAALIAYYEGRLEDALGHLDAMGEGLPWFHEAAELRGDVLLARAMASQREGRREPARADFEAGRQAYSRAGAVAESVPVVWQAAAALEYQVMVMELYGEGAVEPPYERGISATSRALSADPDHHASLALQASFHRGLAEHRNNRGERVDDLLRAAIAAAERAVATGPESAVARLSLSQAHRQAGEVKAGRGEDPSADLQKAVEIAETIGAGHRDNDYHLHMGLVFKVWADYQDEAGVDSVPHRGKAIESYSRALEGSPRAVSVLVNLAANYHERGSQPRGPDPDGDLQKAASLLEQALSVQPAHVVALYYQGNVHQRIGLRKRSRGEDPTADLRRAQAAYERGLAVNGKLHYMHSGVGLALLDLAREAWDRGEDPGPLVERARLAFEQSVAAAPEQGFGHNNVAQALYYRALYAAAQGGDPSADIRAAEGSFVEAQKLLPDNPTCWVNAAKLHLLAAEDALGRGRDPTPALGRADAAIERALKINPVSPEAHPYQAESRALRARFEARRGGDAAGAFESAALAFRRAMELAPGDQDTRVRFGLFCRDRAAWLEGRGGDPTAALTEGLDAVNGVLAVRPSWAEARAVRGGLFLIQARVAARGGKASDLAGKAAEDLSKSLAVNRHLETRWRQDVAAARQLATPR